MKSIFFALCILFITSCSHEIDEGVRRQTDDKGVVITTPYLWKKSLHLNEIAPNGFIIPQVHYKNGVLIPMTDGENHMFSLIDTDNGKTLWDWADEFSPKRPNMYIDYYHQYGNLITFVDGSRSYCLNMDQGTTQWKHQHPLSFHIFASGINEAFFIHGQPFNPSNEYYSSTTFKGNMLTGFIEEFITPNFIFSIAPGNRIGDVTATLYCELNEKPYLAVIWQEPVDHFDWQTYLGLYDYQSDEWIYEKEIMNVPSSSGVLFPPPKIYNHKVYANVGSSIVCHDLITGKQLWKKDFINDFMFSGFIIEDGRLIGNNEDLFTICLDPETGNELWRVRTAGTCGRPSYLNGIVYFAGGSDSKLYAIEAGSGKIVWKINPVLLGEGYDAQFRYNAIYTLPAKEGQPAKVIALSNLYAYCFEAYK